MSYTEEDRDKARKDHLIMWVVGYSCGFASWPISLVLSAVTLWLRGLGQ